MLKEEKQMMSGENEDEELPFGKEAKARETESQEKVQEADSRLQRQGDTHLEERTCDFHRGTGWCTWWSNKIFCLNDNIDVRENSSYVNKSFAVDKLLAAAAPKQ